jgi:hypothetical protein
MAIPILGRLAFAPGWIGSCESAAVFMARGVLARILRGLLALSSGLFGRSRARRRCALHQIILLPSEILAGPGCCFRIADRDPGRNLLSQLDIVVVNNLGVSGVGVERADGCALERQGHFRIQVASNGEKRLRFKTRIANQGPGTLRRSRAASQHLHRR